MPSTIQRIVPHLWYDKEATEAARFYVSVFPESRVRHTSTLGETPSGDVDIVSFDIWGQEFMAFSAGPMFKLNPSISFLVNFDPLLFGEPASREQAARRKLDEVWEKLAEGGKILMPLERYPFSERYGWIQDRYGVSWQLILTNPEGEPRPPIMPVLLFTGKKLGKAKAAMNRYLSVFHNARPGTLFPYPPGQGPTEGLVQFADFQLENQWFAVMDSAMAHDFDFNEAVSLMIKCDTQADIDYYWTLSAVPEAEQCGWIKDEFGVSWQVVPTALDDMLRSGSKDQVARVTRAFLKMKKFDLAALEEAYEKEEALA
ncbi:MAG TPA: VOC family protein [Fibrobacteria bacterium]|nr:VOC family protein [Fibrobacteria bacterium]